MDCSSLAASQRRVKWACEEAAAAAVIAAERHQNAETKEESDEVSEEADNSVDPETVQALAEAAAWDVLHKNLKTDSGGMPPEESFFQGPVRWTLDAEEGTYTVYADCGQALFRLAFLKETVSVKSSGSAYFLPNSTKIY